jgi:hypothetical protein
MSRPALAAAVTALVAAGPALLTNVRVHATVVTFAFRSAPQQIRASYQPRSRIVEAGSGRRVAIRGRAVVVVHFVPAATAAIVGSRVVPTYTGPRRIPGPGPVLEVVKISDFEADLAWAVGLRRRLPLHVVRAGTTVTLRFG